MEMKWYRLAACAAAFMAGSATAQSWPTKPIRLLIPIAAGGATDQLARMMALRLSNALGQPVVAENVTGASGSIALQRLAGSEPDGYTLGATASSLHTIAAHTSKLPYDPIASFTPIGTYAAFEYMMVVGATSPITSLPDLLERAHKAPGNISFGSSGVGTGNHLAGVLLGQLTGVEFNSIPYRGGSPAMLDVIAGRTTFIFDVLGGSVPLIEGGRVKPIASSGVKRHPLFPNVPTVGETVSGYEATGWFALIGPAGLPPEVVRRLSTEINKLQAAPDYRDQLIKLGYDALPGTPTDLVQRMRTETAKWGPIVKSLPCSLLPERCAPGERR